MCTNNIDDAIPLPGHNYTTAQKTNCMPHNATLMCSLIIPFGKIQTRGGRAHHIPLPLGKLHRHVVPGIQYDACVVPGISWSLGKRVFLSCYRIVIVLSYYRYRYTEIVSVRYFSSYRFQTIIPKLSVRYLPQTFISSVFPTPFLLFSYPLLWLSLYSFCSNHTIHTQTGVHSPMLSGFGNDTHQTTTQSAHTAVGAGGPFLP